MRKRKKGQIKGINIPNLTSYEFTVLTNTTCEVMSMAKKNKERKIDNNFFKEMNYELAGEIGVLDDEDMKKNRKLNEKENENIINPS